MGSSRLACLFSLRYLTLSGLGKSEEHSWVPYLVIWVVDSEVAHTDDDLMKEAFTGDAAAVAQQGAGDVPERKGQALCPYDRLQRQGAVRSPQPGRARAAAKLCTSHKASLALCTLCHAARKAYEILKAQCLTAQFKDSCSNK